MIVDPAHIPSVIDPDPAKTIIDWNFCGGADEVRGKDAGCTTVVKYGMKRDLQQVALDTGPSRP